MIVRVQSFVISLKERFCDSKVLNNKDPIVNEFLIHHLLHSRITYDLIVAIEIKHFQLSSIISEMDRLLRK